MAPPLLTLRNAAIDIGDRSLLRDADVAIERGDRICLVGRNGTGKSTLLKALAGAIDLDAGERFLQPRTTIAYLSQTPDLVPGRQALDVVLDGLPPARRDEERHWAEQVLAQFQILPDRKVDTLSGGEARRVALARAKVGSPDILLLDEPTNHLDIKTIERLEADLQDLRGALVMISHDRRFLSNLSRKTWWLDRARLRSLDQDFSAFDTWSAAELAKEEADLHRLSKTIEAETEWLHFGVTARRKRNQGRLRRLHALRSERASRVRATGQAKIELTSRQDGGKLVIEAKEITKSYDDRTLIAPFSTRILRGERIGIIGANGAGKTTLVKLLTGKLTPDQGRVRLGTQLEITTIDQRRDGLDLDRSPWSTLCPDGGDQVLVQDRWRHVVGYLRDFLFRPDQMRTPVRALSGGERNRLLLAKEFAKPANLLVLDEPTNDLDMDTLDLLQEMLADFDGTLLLVSHDRDFLDRLVTSTLVLEGDGTVADYAGGYSDYLNQRPEPVELIEKSTKKAAKTTKRPATGEARRIERKISRLLAEIDALQETRKRLEAELHDPDLYKRDAAAFEAKTNGLTDLDTKLEAAEQRWMDLEIEREQAEA